MDLFKKRNNLQDEVNIDIEKCRQYTNLYKNYKMLNDGSRSTTVSPYNEKDLVDYYTVSSWQNIDEVYKNMDHQMEISKTR
jgi:hypothetical protein